MTIVEELCPICEGKGRWGYAPHDPETGITYDVLMFETCSRCGGRGRVSIATPPLQTLPTSSGRLGLALTPDGLCLSLWEPGEPSREVKLEPHTALDLARRIEREYGGRS